jgi:hypothetical protein
MGLIVVLLILALIFGGIGLLVEGLFWLLIIGAVLLVASLIAGIFTRGRA